MMAGAAVYLIGCLGLAIGVALLIRHRRARQSLGPKGAIVSFAAISLLLLALVALEFRARPTVAEPKAAESGIVPAIRRGQASGEKMIQDLRNRVDDLSRSILNPPADVRSGSVAHAEQATRKPTKKRATSHAKQTQQKDAASAEEGVVMERLAGGFSLVTPRVVARGQATAGDEADQSERPGIEAANRHSFMPTSAGSPLNGDALMVCTPWSEPPTSAGRGPVKVPLGPGIWTYE